MKHEDLTHRIIGCAYRAYNQLGFGFLESVYKKAMIIELNNELRIDVLRSQNIIPVELSLALDFKVSVAV
jgi:GxxExxY protein